MKRKLEGIIKFTDTKADKYPCLIMLHGFNSKHRSKKRIGRKIAYDHSLDLLEEFDKKKKALAIFTYTYKGHDDSGVLGDISDDVLDVSSLVNFLETRKEFDTEKIGLLAGSYGCMIAAKVLQRDPRFKFATFTAPFLGKENINPFLRKIFDIFYYMVPDLYIPVGNNVHGIFTISKVENYRMIKESENVENAKNIDIPVQFFLLPDAYANLKGFLFCSQHINHRFFNNLPSKDKEIRVLRRGNKEEHYHDRIKRLQVDFIDKQLYME